MPARHLAVHYLGGDGATTLYAHATGFHAHIWSPIARQLPGLHNVGYDARGHGDTPIGTDWPTPDAVDWTVYGHDAALVAHSLSVDGRVLGVGHSMGGAALLMAALSAPELFSGLVVYEPIVMPPEAVRPEGRNNHLADGARRRRSTFPSFEAAIANFAAKPPLNVFTAETLEAYVRHGFGQGEDGQVHLKCTPEHEARTYEAGGNHRTWEHLGEITVPVWVLSGQPQPEQPSANTAALAERIPGSRYIQLDHLGHFGPMQAPDEIAALVGEASLAFHHGGGDPHQPD
jgi:pimeloyl-ACP methyl ester carboxylesterase